MHNVPSVTGFIRAGFRIQRSGLNSLRKDGHTDGICSTQDAIKGITDWGVTVGQVTGKLPRATDAFRSLTFNDEVQKARLPKPVYKALRRTITAGEPLDPSAADIVAAALKDWAVEHGATHYTHWFQPLTGITAEKHDSFLSPDGPRARRSRSSAARS